MFLLRLLLHLMPSTRLAGESITPLNADNTPNRRPFLTLTQSPLSSLNILVEPLHSLQERLLLREFEMLLGQVGARGEAMARAGVKHDLVRGLHLRQEVLGLAALVSREDEVIL